MEHLLYNMISLRFVTLPQTVKQMFGTQPFRVEASDQLLM